MLTAGSRRSRLLPVNWIWHFAAPQLLPQLESGGNDVRALGDSRTTRRDLDSGSFYRFAACRERQHKLGSGGNETERADDEPAVSAAPTIFVPLFVSVTAGSRRSRLFPVNWIWHLLAALQLLNSRAAESMVGPARAGFLTIRRDRDCGSFYRLAA